MCLGKPVIALSNESMTWDISDSLENLESLNYQINRTQWLYDMAYTQWTPRRNCQRYSMGTPEARIHAWKMKKLFRIHTRVCGEKETKK